ncbi:hypothetical protein WJX77_000002 [Trebouxia sp. C0004]
MLKVKTSRSAKAPPASRRGSLWRTKPLYLSQPKELTLPVRKELQKTKASRMRSTYDSMAAPSELQAASHQERRQQSSVPHAGPTMWLGRQTSMSQV